MSKLECINFMISEDEDRKAMFRFYPENSHMHSHGEEPPKSLYDVYKVYYSWGIFTSFGDDEYEESFYMDCDECSALEYLGDEILEVISGATDSLTSRSIGQPGSIWNITYHRGFTFGDYGEPIPDPARDRLTYEVWDNWSDKGYRFSMSVEKSKEFVEYLKKVNEHMLENGEPV